MIKSKKIKKKNLRKRSSSVLDEDENLDETSNLIQEAMEIRKFRMRPDGMETKELSIGEENKKPVEEEEEQKEPISNPFSDTVIASSFKTQTNYMDTEKLMNKYIEDEIRKNRGENVEKEEEEEDELQQSTTATDEFNSMYQIPDNLKVKEKYIKEDNVTTSLSMLTSIQEVDLGIENKLKNIEATEKARKKLEEDKKKKKNTVNNLIGVSTASERFYKAKPNDNKRYDRMFSDKDKDQSSKDSNDNKNQREMSKNPLIAKINRANSHNTNKSNNNNNNNNRSSHGGGRNYDKRNMATDDIAFERFKKRFRK